MTRTLQIDLRNYKYINNLKIYNKSNAVTFVKR